MTRFSGFLLCIQNHFHHSWLPRNDTMSSADLYAPDIWLSSNVIMYTQTLHGEDEKEQH